MSISPPPAQRLESVELVADEPPWSPPLPADWPCRRAKYVLRRMQRPARPADGIVTAFRDGQVTLRKNRRVEGFTNSLKEIGYQGVRQGDLIVHAMDAFAGAIGVSDSDGKCTPVYSVCTGQPKLGACMRYYAYLLRHVSESGYIYALARGVRERSTEFRFAELQAMLVPVPSSTHQRAIADFLDRETEKIDALVAKKQRLIELLQEKRTAVISRAVTRGLSSDVATKDSGIAWLGSIPAHWNALPLRRGLLRIEQGWSPECENRLADDGEWGVLRAGCVNHGEFAPDQHKALPSGLMPRPGLEVRPGDLLMSRASGSTELVGSVAYVTQCRERLMLSDKVFRLHTDPRRMNAEYLALAMNSQAVRAQIESVLSGSVGLARNIGQSTIRELAVCFPPLNEQRTIVRDLEADAGPTRILVCKVVQAIERLREYRSALITAAVTGQIDGREYERKAS